MAVITKFVKPGSWQTLESFWNVGAVVFFRGPAGAKIKIHYGGWWFSKDRQEQTLDGIAYKKLSVSGAWSFFRAQIQIYTTVATNVTYDVEMGSVGVTTPSIQF